MIEINLTQMWDLLSSNKRVWVVGVSGAGKSTLAATIGAVDADKFGKMVDKKWVVTDEALKHDRVVGVCDNFEALMRQTRMSKSEFAPYVVVMMEPELDLWTRNIRRKALMSRIGDGFLQSYLNILRNPELEMDRFRRRMEPLAEYRLQMKEGDLVDTNQAWGNGDIKRAAYTNVGVLYDYNSLPCIYVSETSDSERRPAFHVRPKFENKESRMLGSCVSYKSDVSRPLGHFIAVASHYKVDALRPADATKHYHTVVICADRFPVEMAWQAFGREMSRLAGGQFVIHAPLVTAGYDYRVHHEGKTFVCEQISKEQYVHYYDNIGYSF